MFMDSGSEFSMRFGVQKPTTNANLRMTHSPLETNAPPLSSKNASNANNDVIVQGKMQADYQ